MNELYGPPLPPGYKRRSPSPPSPHNKEDSIISNATLNINEDYSESDHSNSSEKTKTHIIGPALPPGFKPISSDSDDESNNTNSKQDIIGPVLPPGFNTSNDTDSMIGPQPYTGDEISHSYLAALEVDSRAKKMKDKLLGKNEDDQVKRETWMLELPSVGKKFGLEARKFSRNPASKSADRSGWTDTPSDKVRKEKEEQSGEKESKPTAAEIYDAKKNNQLTDAVESYNKTNRTESLMEMHQKSRKRKAEEKNKPEERRAFDRDTDLQVNRLDEAQRKQLIKRSQGLNTRFSHGHTTSHFL